MESYILQCSSLACRMSYHSPKITIEAESVIKALEKHPVCTKCGARMEEKKKGREKR